MAVTPAGGGNSAQGYELDSTFGQQEFVGEIDERHQLWGEPGKLKVTGFVIHGRMGDFQDAVALSQPGQPFAGDPSDALASVRVYRLRPGVSLNLICHATCIVNSLRVPMVAVGTTISLRPSHRSLSSAANAPGSLLWRRSDETVEGVMSALAERSSRSCG
jgi:hypothetical protein